MQLVTFAVTPFYLDFTSNELYGYWLTIGSILGWLYLSDFGVGMALSRFAVAAIEKKDVALLNFYIRNAFFLFSMVSLLFIAIGIVLAPHFVRWFDVKPQYLNTFRLTYYTTILTGTLALPLSVFPSTLEAFQKIFI